MIFLKNKISSKYTCDKRGPPVVRARLGQLRRPRPRPRRREVPHGRQRPDVPRRQPRGRRRAVVVPHQRAVAGEQDGAGDAALTAVELLGECNKSNSKRSKKQFIISIPDIKVFSDFFIVHMCLFFSLPVAPCLY